MWFVIIAAIYAIMSTVTFFAFWLDKRAASRNVWRTPETTLHALETIGGWPGALLAQKFLRHKSSKLSYRITLWTIVALHAVAWGAVWWFAS